MGNENSSRSFPWAMGDVGMCQLGASNPLQRSSAAWLHTSHRLYLFTTASRIRQCLPKIATSSKGLWEHPALRADLLMTVCLCGVTPGSGCETTSKHWHLNDEYRQLPKANPAAQSLGHPLVYKSVKFQLHTVFSEPFSICTPKCSGRFL